LRTFQKLRYPFIRKARTKVSGLAAITSEAFPDRTVQWQFSDVCGVFIVVFLWWFRYDTSCLLNHRNHRVHRKLHTVAHSAQALHLLPLKYTGIVYHKDRLFYKIFREFFSAQHNHFGAVLLEKFLSAEAPVYTNNIEACIHACLHINIRIADENSLLPF